MVPLVLKRAKRRQLDQGELLLLVPEVIDGGEFIPG